jgi:hypothetical protein
MSRMTRALDHLVIAYRDLDAAAERYRRLGFQVSNRNRHPWGTENHIVQFDGAFLELVGLGAGFAPPAPDDPVFPFAGFIAEFLQSREGLAMLVLRSADAEADRVSFAAQGIGDRPRFDFARRGQRAGREVDVAFSLTFAQAPASLQAGFFTSQQRFPENFWDKAAQVHPNGATGVAELDVAHPQPEIAAPFLTAFLGAAPAESAGVRRFALEKTVVTLSASAPAGLRAARVAARGGLIAID